MSKQRKRGSRLHRKEILQQGGQEGEEEVDSKQGEGEGRATEDGEAI